jgi:hypothetical protein
MTLSADWVPSIIRWGRQPMLEWCHLGDLRFTDPFFEQTIRRAAHQPFNLLFSRRTPLDDILAAPPGTGLRLGGLIFHMSRCGSTVVSQMLAALARNVVLSEPAPLDQILRVPVRLGVQSRGELVPYLRGIVAAFSRSRQPEERDLFIKLDAWHILLLPLFRRAFPDVPWVFVYRDPLEVMASLARSRPLQMYPDWIEPALLGLARSKGPELTADAYTARLVATLMNSAIEHHAGGGLLVEYGDLPDAVCTRVLDHFGLHYGNEDRAAMRTTARIDVKQAGVPFQQDGQAKRQSASCEIRELAATQLAPLYARLNELRRKGFR